MTARPMSVLVLCTGNSARSQMTEAFIRQLSNGTIDVESAGSAPQPEIHPMARTAAQRILGVDMAGQFPKRLDRFFDRRFDYVITVCDRAAETCPLFPGSPKRVHWGVEDPAAVPGNEAERQQAFDAAARELLDRVRSWLAHDGPTGQNPADDNHP